MIISLSDISQLMTGLIMRYFCWLVGPQWKIWFSSSSNKLWTLSMCIWEWVHNFSAISWREQITFHWDDDVVRFVLDHH